MSVEVPAPPTQVLHRLLRQRPLWLEDLQQETVLERLDQNTDLYRYSRRHMAPQPSREYVLLRSGQDANGFSSF